jgi:hypothetical protein
MIARDDHQSYSHTDGRLVLLHAVHFFQTYREVGELEIALSFALLQMSWGR